MSVAPVRGRTYHPSDSLALRRKVLSPHSRHLIWTASVARGRDVVIERVGVVTREAIGAIITAVTADAMPSGKMGAR